MYLFRDVSFICWYSQAKRDVGLGYHNQDLTFTLLPICNYPFSGDIYYICLINDTHGYWFRAVKRCTTLANWMSSGHLFCLCSSFPTLCTTSFQFIPFGSAEDSRMKNKWPFGACLPLPPIIILMHLIRFLRLCLSIVDVHLILASPSQITQLKFNYVRECTIIEMDTAHDLVCVPVNPLSTDNLSSS